MSAFVFAHHSDFDYDDYQDADVISAGDAQHEAGENISHTTLELSSADKVYRPDGYDCRLANP